MRKAVVAAIVSLAAVLPAAPALAVPTVVFSPMVDDSISVPMQERGDHGQIDGAYDVLARFVRDARFEVARSITVGENPTLDPFVETIGRGGQERSSLGDFRLPPNARQILEDGGNGNGGLLDLLTLSTVPEPSLWIMMILGTGLIGSRLRRRGAERKVFLG